MIDGRLRVPETVKAGEPFEVRVLILHPMENGFRHDASGREIPVHIVNKFSCTYGGREVFGVDLGTGISANPYLVFYVRAAQSGELKVDWADDAGERGSASANVNVG